MTQIEEKEVKKLLKDNPHLKKYVEEVEKKIGKPEFFSKVPRDVKEEEYPNLIYVTKGVVFIHIFKTKDMEKPEYHAVDPQLNDVESKKRDLILELIYEKAHLKTDIKTQDELRKAIREVLEKITVVDETSGGKLGKYKGGKVKVSSV